MKALSALLVIGIGLALVTVLVPADGSRAAGGLSPAGDVDCGGSLDPTDALLILQSVAGLAGAPTPCPHQPILLPEEAVAMIVNARPGHFRLSDCIPEWAGLFWHINCVQARGQPQLADHAETWDACLYEASMTISDCPPLT